MLTDAEPADDDKSEGDEGEREQQTAADGDVEMELSDKEDEDAQVGIHLCQSKSSLDMYVCKLLYIILVIQECI